MTPFLVEKFLKLTNAQLLLRRPRNVR